MQRSVRFVLHASYYYALFMGMLPFHYNLRKQKVYTSAVFNVCTATANIFLIAAIPLVWKLNWAAQMEAKAPLLQRITYGVVTTSRILAVLVTLLLNWAKRPQFLAGLNDFLCLQQEYLERLPRQRRLQRSFERGVLFKFGWAFLDNFLALTLSVDVVRSHLNPYRFFVMLWISLLFNVMSILMNHYYFVMKYICSSFGMLNAELERILQAARTIEKLQTRDAAYIGQCCQLADQLDAMARAHHRLLQLIRRINAMFSIQTACVLLNLFVNNIATIYFGFAVTRHDASKFGVSSWGQLLWITMFFAYYSDLKVFVWVMFELLEVLEAVQKILRQELPLIVLDKRLERRFEIFCWQLIQNPLKIKVLGLFEFNKPVTFSIFCSSISIAIILMQFDFQYY